MAVINTSQVAVLMKEHYETPFTDAMNRDVTLFNWFPRKSMKGKSVQWKIHRPNAGEQFPDTTAIVKGTSYGEDDALTATNKQAYIEAEIIVKQNYVGVQVNGLTQAATSSSEAAYFEVLGEETKEALEDLKNSINTQIMSTAATYNSGQTTGAGNSNLDIDGFRGIIINGNTASRYYGGIALDTYTWFKSYVLANGGTPRALTLAMLQNVTTEMEKPHRSGAKVTDVLCGRVHFNQYGNLLADYRRYVNPDKMDGGYSSLAFEDKAITSVPGLPAGGMWFIDKSEWGYYILQNFETKPQSLNTDADRYVITHYSQLVCKHPGKQAAIIDLITS